MINNHHENQYYVGEIAQCSDMLISVIDITISQCIQLSFPWYLSTEILQIAIDGDKIWGHDNKIIKNCFKNINFE